MSQSPRIIPWLSWDEFLTVHNSIFGQESKDRRWAVDVIAMWRERGRLPHSIDATAALTDVFLQDISTGAAQTVQEITEVRSDSALRNLYSMAIIRAVNGLVDPSQQSYYADSVLSLATRIDIPAWIVEIRHDATHNALPSLLLLRNAAQHMLQWLKVNYWQQQLLHLQTLSEACLPIKKSKKRKFNDSVNKPSSSTAVSFQNCCPTLLLDILIPLFLEDVLSRTKDTSRTFREHATVFPREMKKRRAAWLPALQSAIRSCSFFASTIIMRILVRSTTIFEAQQFESAVNIQESSWKLQACCFWVKELASIADKNKLRNFLDSMISSFVEKVDSMPQLCYSRLHPLLTIVDEICPNERLKSIVNINVDKKLPISPIWTVDLTAKEVESDTDSENENSVQLCYGGEELDQLEAWLVNRNQAVGTLPLPLYLSQSLSNDDVNAKSRQLLVTPWCSSSRIEEKNSDSPPCWPLGLMNGTGITSVNNLIFIVEDFS